jgi:hypothetical protein
MFIMSEMGPKPRGEITSKILVPRKLRVPIHHLRNQGINVNGVPMRGMTVKFVQRKATTKQFVRASQVFPSQLTKLRAWGKIRSCFSGRSMGKVMILGLHK